MADLIDRISGASLPERPKINLHRFMAVERLYALGKCTGAEIVAEFDLQGDELAQANQLKAQIDGVPQADAKVLYILRAESVLMCIEDHADRLYHDQYGAVNKVKVCQDLSIAG